MISATSGMHAKAKWQLLWAIITMSVFMIWTNETTVAFHVTTIRVYGELDGVSILHCNILPRNTSLHKLVWRAGNHSRVIYEYSFDNNTNLENLTTERNISGRFDNFSKCHELTIHRTIFSDEGRYVCSVKNTHREEAMDSVYLYLVVPLKNPLSLEDRHGLTMSTTRCNDTHNIPLVRVRGIQSFSSVVRSTRPRSYINCWCEGEIYLHPEKLTVSKQMDTNVFSVRRQIDVTCQQCHLLQCSAYTPSPISEVYDNKTVCLRLEKADVRYKATCSRQYGELGSMSKLSCSVSPVNATIRLVTWSSGSYLQPVFRASPGGRESDGPIGRFAGRNITGFFDDQNITHTIMIYNSTAEDETLYTASFIIRLSPIAKDHVFLKLTVTPTSPPAIFKADGTLASNIKCDDQLLIPNMTLSEGGSFLCVIRASRPKPKTEWIYRKLSRIYEETCNTSVTRGLITYSVKRKIDIRAEDTDKGSVLKCNLELPDPATGGLKKADVCLRLFRKKGESESNSQWLYIFIAISGTLAIIIFGYVGYKCVRKHAKRPQTNRAPPNSTRDQDLQRVPNASHIPDLGPSPQNNESRSSTEPLLGGASAFNNASHLDSDSRQGDIELDKNVGDHCNRYGTLPESQNNELEIQIPGND